MNEDDITTVKLVINSESANSELGKVKKNIEDLTGKLLEARKAGDKVLADIYTKDIKKAEAQTKRIETRAKTVESVLQNLDKATPKKLKDTSLYMQKAMQFLVLLLEFLLRMILYLYL